MKGRERDQCVLADALPGQGRASLCQQHQSEHSDLEVAENQPGAAASALGVAGRGRRAGGCARSSPLVLHCLWPFGG